MKIFLIVVWIYFIAESVAEESQESPIALFTSYITDTLLRKHGLQEKERTGRSSPTASIAGYITSYREKKKRLQLRKMNKTRKHLYTKQRKPCYYSYYY